VETVDESLLTNKNKGITTVKVVYTVVDESVDNLLGCEFIF
jgi:hypothetical protein